MGTVDDYLASLDEPVRGMFAAIRDRALELVPDATQGISYGMPALLHRGKGLLSTMQSKTHLSLFPFSGSIPAQVEDRLAGFSLSKGTIRFSVDRPIPPDVVDRIILLRRDEIDAKAG
ncbi:iron chaperone [Microbacterium rhizophilus]|uniref:iron chaperone n=1 Tax=Microbacterium rhizophilus TaxID=3138934 RepID=UPI0031EE88E7